MTETRETYNISIEPNIFFRKLDTVTNIRKAVAEKHINKIGKAPTLKKKT